MTFRRVHAIAAVLALTNTNIQAKDPRELTLELLSDRAGWSNLKMASRSGARYECSAGEARLASQVTQKTPPDKPATLATLLAALDGQCAKLSQGWWTYEWCHRRYVRQFHAQGSKIDPDWSLGGYSRTVVKGDLDMKNAPADPALARDVFDQQGQICHETNTLRQTNVTFKCCEPDKRRRHRTYLVSVDETSLCNYEVVVCSPSLCTQPEPQKRNASAQELLKALDGTCLQRHEGWWSFELCYGTHARQFHVETVEASDGRKKAKVAAEFSLGDRMEKRRKPSASDVVVVEGDEPRVEVTYEGGTACDVDVEGDGVVKKRSTTARLVCGETNALVSIVEDRTCHYLFKVTTPVLCGHAAFVKDEPTRPVTCVALDPVDDVEEEEVEEEDYYDYEDDDDDEDEEDEEDEDLPAVRGPPGLKVGARVAARWKGGLVYYPGRVVSDHGDGSYDIDYDDGDTEDNVPAALIKLQRGEEL